MPSSTSSILSAPASGLLIAFEGVDATGKTTQIEQISRWMGQCGLPVVTTREPGGTSLGSTLRNILLQTENVTPRAEALLFAADRAQHVATVIKPALEVGKIVLTDRYEASSIAYQGTGRELGNDEIRFLSRWATKGLDPHLTILFDLDPQIARQRRNQEQHPPKPDRIEKENLEFQQKVRQRYLRLAQDDPTWVVIDAALSPAEITAIIRQRIETLLAANNHPKP